MDNWLKNRPSTTVILAMSADGKIADVSHGAARFGSFQDRAHLEHQVAQADAVLFGTGTLRAYGTTLSVSQPELIQHRQQQGKPPQPIQIVCSRFAEINPQYRFFRQSIPRWLLTTKIGCDRWQARGDFERIVVAETLEGAIDWHQAFQQLCACNIQHLAVLGGGTLVAALLELDLIDEIWLTVCPLILGGERSTTPVEGTGFLQSVAPRLQLLEVRSIDHEIFLHYRIIR